MKTLIANVKERNRVIKIHEGYFYGPHFISDIGINILFQYSKSGTARCVIWMENEQTGTITHQDIIFQNNDTKVHISATVVDMLDIPEALEFFHIIEKYYYSRVFNYFKIT